jgi:hypothetical protein
MVKSLAVEFAPGDFVAGEALAFEARIGELLLEDDFFDEADEADSWVETERDWPVALPDIPFEAAFRAVVLLAGARETDSNFRSPAARLLLTPFADFLLEPDDFAFPTELVDASTFCCAAFTGIFFAEAFDLPVDDLPVDLAALPFVLGDEEVLLASAEIMSSLRMLEATESPSRFAIAVKSALV